MEKIIRKKLKKSAIALSAGLMLSTAVAPSIITTVEASSSVSVNDEVELKETDVDDIVNEIITNIESSGIPAPAPNPIDDSMVGTNSISIGLLAGLAAKYGMVWLKTTLPKIVYGSVAPFIGKVVSQSKFISIFNKGLAAGTTAALRSTLENGLVAAGVSRSTASRITGIIVTTVGLIS